MFFKFNSNAVELKYSSGKVTINTTVLESVREAIKKKLADYAKDYVAKLPDSFQWSSYNGKLSANRPSA